MEKVTAKIAGEIKTVILNTLANKLTMQDGVRIARLTHNASSEDDTCMSEYAITLTPFDVSDLDGGLHGIKRDIIIDVVTTHFGSALKNVEMKRLTNLMLIEFNIIWGDVYYEISNIDIYISNLMRMLLKINHVDNIGRIHVIDMDEMRIESNNECESEYSERDIIFESDIRYIVSADIDIYVQNALKNAVDTSYVDVLHDIRNTVLKCSFGYTTHEDKFQIESLGLLDNGRYIQMSINVTI